MKTKNALATLATLMMFLAGCIPSLYPLYSRDDRIKMDKIIGKWLMDDSSSSYEISVDPDDPYSYLFSYYQLESKIHDSSQATFEVNMVTLGGENFMDFFPADNEVLDNMNILLAIHLVPAHTFARFSLSGDTLTIWRFNPGWLDKLFEENRIRISHEKVLDQIVLTAPTEELQKFVTKYAGDPDAYVDPEILIRQRI